MAYYFTLLLFFLISLEAVSNDLDPRCPAHQKLSEENMNPLAIQDWLKTTGSKVKNIEQFVCCLPKEYQKQYMAGHSSVAAQTGTPHSPRVVMFQSEQKLDATVPHKMFALSINGGADGQPQGQNVEMMFLDPKSKKLQYFDLAFNGDVTPKLSKENPTECMSCHGLNGKAPAGGPRPVFGSFQRWNPFVGGRVGFCSKTEEKYFRHIEAAAVKAIKANPRFACLDKKSLDSDPNEQRQIYQEQNEIINTFHNNIASLNDQRLPNLITSYRDFPKLKFGLIGLTACGGSFSDWLPEDVVNKIRSGEAIDAELKGADWKDQAQKKLDKIEAAWARNEAKMQSELLQNEIPMDKPFTPPKGDIQACAPNKETRESLGLIPRSKKIRPKKIVLDPDEVTARVQVTDPDGKPNDNNEIPSSKTSEEEVQDPPVTFRYKLTDETDRNLLERYIVQNRMEGIHGDYMLRFVFQSLGENISFWNPSPTGDYSMTFSEDPLGKIIYEQYKNSELMKHILGKYFDIKSYPITKRFDGLIYLAKGKGLAEKPHMNSCEEFKKFVRAENAKGRSRSAKSVQKAIK